MEQEDPQIFITTRAMVRNLTTCFWVSLLLLLLPASLFSQTADERWAVSIGASGDQFRPIGEQVFSGTTPYFPGAGVAVTRYLRPGFDFRTRAGISPMVQDPLSTEPSQSSYLSFDYTFIVKLNNGILFREDSRIAPYLFGGAGGSYHAGHADAYSPVGGGIGIRVGERSKIRIEAQRRISWNKAPQTLGVGLFYSYTFKSKKPPVIEEEAEELSTEDLIASTMPADSDGDGLPDTEDDCPYEAGFIQNNGCPQQDTVEVVATESQLPEEQQAVAVMEEEEVPPSIEVPAPEIVAEEEVVIAVEEGEEVAVIDPQPMEFEEAPMMEVPAIEPPDITGVPAESVEEFPCGMPSIESVSFARFETELSEEDRAILAGIAQQIQDCPGIRLRLTEFANEKGSADGNLVLSIKRAYNIKYYLVYEFGISQSRIYSKGKGSDSGENDSRSVSFEWSS